MEKTSWIDGLGQNVSVPNFSVVPEVLNFAKKRIVDGDRRRLSRAVVEALRNEFLTQLIRRNLRGIVNFQIIN